MARAISDEEQQLRRRARRRLIGAIVLVTAVVVVLPMVLDPEPRPADRPVSVRIPSPDSGAFIPRIPAPVAAVDGKAAAAAPETKPAASAEPEPPAAAPPVKRATVQPAKQRTTTPKSAAAEPGNGQYVVQVIALADRARAQKMKERIAAAGIDAYTEVVKTQKGDVTRVRAGPFSSRQAAEQARDQLKMLGMNGNVTAR